MALRREARLYQRKKRKLQHTTSQVMQFCSMYLPDVGPVHTISIIPTGMGAAGYTMPLPEKDEMFNDKGSAWYRILS